VCVPTHNASSELRRTTFAPSRTARKVKANRPHSCRHIDTPAKPEKSNDSNDTKDVTAETHRIAAAQFNCRLLCRAWAPSPGIPIQARPERQSCGRTEKATLDRTRSQSAAANGARQEGHAHHDKERILTKAAAGIEQLVDQFARGDRYARRDLFDLADKLGLDLGASSKAALEELTGKALAAEDEALVADFVRRKTGKSAGNDDAHPARDNWPNLSL